MNTVNLNGVWFYRTAGRESTVTVPFSRIAVGRSVCEKHFDITREKTAFLVMEGITYHAWVTLNGVFLGEMLPYCEYRFDITDTVREKDNVLSVELEDINTRFGPTEGFENFGGIIRGVYVKTYGGAYIENVFFRSTLSPDYRDAEYTLDVKLSETADYTVTLFDGGIAADSFVSSKPSVKRKLKNVKLWSTESPGLYRLRVTAGDDEYTCFVGFREIKCDKHAFIINGKPTFLQGVCKHEMIGDSGHTPALSDIEKDLRMIKETGCNFVRLVHYPHSKETLDIADRIGLFVSEEPGLWWSDTSNEEVADGSIEVLRRTVKRDRNHPSVAFWLCFNECKFTEDFLIRSAKACKETDPTRPVSGANCMSVENTLKYYNLCGFDFYTMHPYGPTFDKARETAGKLTDKPLIFTEWGGYHVYDNPHLLSDFICGIKELYENRSDTAALAGAFFWEWSEVNDFSRGKPACVDGVLKEGLTDKYRNPTLIFEAFRDAFAKRDTADSDLYEYTPFTEFSGTPMAGSGGADFSEMLSAAHKSVPSYFLNMRFRQLKIGPKLAKNEMQMMYTTPFCISAEKSAVFTGKAETDTLYMIGAVSAPYGYPLSEYGELLGKVTVTFSDGKSETLPLRSGVEITSALTLLGSSRIDPQAEKAVPFARFSYDKNHEQYLINLLPLKLRERKTVTSVTVEGLKSGNFILVYGMFT